MTTETKITPHKGGRTERINGIRCTPATLEQLRAIIEARNTASRKRYSLADWVEEKVLEDLAKAANNVG